MHGSRRDYGFWFYLRVRAPTLAEGTTRSAGQARARRQCCVRARADSARGSRRTKQ